MTSPTCPAPEDAVFSGARVSKNGSRVFLCGHDGFVRGGHRGLQGRADVSRDPGDAGDALSPDGNTIAYQTKDKTITLREIDTDRIRAVLRGHDQDPHAVHITADSCRVVTASIDGTLRVWDAETGRIIQNLHPFESGVGGMRISPDGRRAVATDLTNRDVRLWNLDTGTEIASLAWHERGLYSICFNRGGDRVITRLEGFPSNELKLWDATTGQLIRVMGRHSNTVSEIVFSSDGTRIASASMDQTVRLWDGTTGRPVATLKGHNGRVTCVAFSHHSSQLISGSEDHTVRLWDAETGESHAVLTGHTAAITSVGFSADSSHIISASLDGSIRLWDAQMAQSDGILRGHSSFVYSAAFHPDGERVARPGWDSTARIWEATTGRQLALLKHEKNSAVTAVAIHPMGRLIATRAREIVAPGHEFVFLWDLETGRELRRWSAPSGVGRTRAWRSARRAICGGGMQGRRRPTLAGGQSSEVAVLHRP